MNKAGLLFLAFGSVSAALMGFTGREIAAAFRHAAGRAKNGESRQRSAYFWEAAARNAWMLGALGSVLNFTITLGGESGGIGDIANRMIQSLVVVLYGLVLAAACLVPGMKLAEGLPARQAAGASGAGAPASLRPDRTAAAGRVAGYALFAATFVATALFLMAGQQRSGPLPFTKILLHGPAILVVIGGAAVLAFFMGRGVGARAWTLGFAMTGSIALLTGLIQALFGFAHTNVEEIAAAVAFIITAVAFALLGLMAVAAPLEDREVMDGRRDKAGPISRVLWIVFPLLAFIALVLTFVMIMTPMTKKAG